MALSMWNKVGSIGGGHCMRFTTGFMFLPIFSVNSEVINSRLSQNITEFF
jgi:hypothetical protein